MHEWIPVACGAVLMALSPGRVSRVLLLGRIALLALIVVAVMREWSTIAASLPLDVFLVVLGALIARAVAHLVRALRPQRPATPICQ